MGHHGSVHLPVLGKATCAHPAYKGAIPKKATAAPGMVVLHICCCHLDEVTLAGDITLCLKLAAERPGVPAGEESWFLPSLPHCTGAQVELSHREL